MQEAVATEPEASSNLFSLDLLRAHARTLAQQTDRSVQPRKAVNLFGRIESAAESIRATFEMLSASGRRGEAISRDAEWLLDNFYVVEEQLHEIEEDLPPQYFAELPKTESGEPRVYLLASELIGHTDGLLDEALIVDFVQTFQELCPLTIGEVWAVPIMLRMGLVEQLSRLSVEMRLQRQQQLKVQQWLTDWPGGPSLPAELVQTDQTILLAWALMWLDECPADEWSRLAPLERLLLERCPDLHQRVREIHQRQAARQLSVGNLITAMRLLSALDWMSFFERCSYVEQALRTDPAAAYAEMDDDSRDRYRHLIEKLAKRSETSELAVAQAAIRLAASVTAEGAISERQRHVGFWLVDDGRPVLERECGYRPTLLDGIIRTLQHSGVQWYAAAILTITVGSLLTVLNFHRPLHNAMALLMGFPVALALSELAVGLVNYFVTRIVPPSVLPKLDLAGGVPVEHRSIVVVPSMLTSRDDLAEMLRRLELHYVANAETNVSFALLTDFADASSEILEQDADLIAAARAGIQELNLRHVEESQGPFYLFHRRRCWNASEGKWMGWERKRGKLTEFNRWLRGARDTTYNVMEGDLESLQGNNGSRVRYVITCDADTQLPHGAVRRLIGTMAHPLVCPRFEGDNRRPTVGYTLIQPRVGVTLADGRRSWYSRIMANSRGIDPYGTAASDVYQDLCKEGSFTGKGIYDIDAFERCLQGRFAENQILSHDLIEGCYVRAALASDIELMDGFPARYDADSRRQHRWVRGDWQILPWLFPVVPGASGWETNPLSALSRWKIADNLRRSLAPAGIVLTMILGWLWAPSSAWLWSMLGVLGVGTPVFIALISSLEQLTRARDWSTGCRVALFSINAALLQVGVLAISLPHRALSNLDAVARTLWRMTMTRRLMLEWQTAAAAERLLSQRRHAISPTMITVSVISVVLAMLLPAEARLSAAPWLLAWLVSPLVLEWISRPLVRSDRDLDRTTEEWLRQIARLNWCYFEETMHAGNHWLPPDNVQEYPSLKVADRLSPTNEGLFLVSVLAARDFGYLGVQEMTEWWERNLESLSKLPRVGGHFFNWYETTTLTPLRPRYLSTVDSGNLAASLLVMRQGLSELSTQPVLAAELWPGLIDTLAISGAGSNPMSGKSSHGAPHVPGIEEPLKLLHRLSASPPAELMDWPSAVAVLRMAETMLERGFQAVPEDGRTTPAITAAMGPARAQRWLKGVLRDYDALYAWLDLFESVDRLTSSKARRVAGVSNTWVTQDACLAAWGELRRAVTGLNELEALATAPQTLQRDLDHLRIAMQRLGGDTALSAGQWLSSFQTSLETSAQRAAALLERWVTMGRSVERLVEEMNFEPLYDPLRRLFSIGYNLEENRLDGSYYDLLCSEARLSSYIAIAKGDVPVRHWFRLGRQTTYTGGQVGLLSWGGTMFEFLMPLIFQPMIPGSLLAAACEAAVAQQQIYGKQRGVPWGVSESAFASLSPNSDYQYQSFGVPGLGLKRGLSKDNVVAPYATILALEIEPWAAVHNLRRLESEGLVGRWGFYEAVDFTTSRLPAGRKFAPVRCFMAHHQGMSFLSLANLLLDGSVRRRFRAHPEMRAAELLLQEGVPVSSQVMMPHADEVAEVRVVRAADQPVVSRRIGTYSTPTPRAHLLSNGSYAVMLSNSGGGYSRYRDIAISRWRSDVTLDNWGQWLYLSDVRTGELWSATYQPTCKVPDEYEVIYSIDKAEFRRRDGLLELSLEVAISPEDSVEVRQLRLTNLGPAERRINLTSYVELVLTTTAADVAHPAFQKLFVETEYVPESMALLARRRPRSAGDPVLWAVHVLCPGDVEIEDLEYETSRAEFVGRGRTAQSPAALDRGQHLSGTTGAVLDPIFSFQCRVRVAADSSARVAFVTGYATSREEALKLAGHYHDWRAAQRAFELAWAFNQIELRHWRATATQTHRFQRLASAVLYPTLPVRGSVQAITQNRLRQSDLWSFGISGDRPIVVVHINHMRQLSFVRELLIAQEFWAYRQLHVDLVLLNCLAGSYLDELQEQLQRLVNETPQRTEVRPGRAYVLRGSQVSAGQIGLLDAVAAVSIDAARGWSVIDSGTQTVGAVKTTSTPLAPVIAQEATILSPTSAAIKKREADDRTGLDFWNGYGGFRDEGREYHIAPGLGRATPMPWSNILANPEFGCLMTESGGGYTWAGNSRENKLTVWRNDPISDLPAEQLYVTEFGSGTCWPIFGRIERPAVTRTVQHGQGWSRWNWQGPELQLSVLVSIAADDSVKLIEVELQNQASTARQFSLTYFVEWVLGVSREETQLHLVTEADPEYAALLALNSYHADYPEQCAFLQCTGSAVTVTGDRTAFLGRNGSFAAPAGLRDSGLDGTVGAGLDPCGVVQTIVSVPARKSALVAFVLGWGADRKAARELQHRYRALGCLVEAREATRELWENVIEAVQIETPNRAFDLLVNRWLIYQTLSCRIWGRSGYYQASGAYGFRDQLQDVMALAYSRPDLVREHLLRAAARQYVEGDVQHWWHVPSGKGTRTRFADDLLWLIVASCHYVSITQDESVWEEVVPFLESPTLTAEEHERYEQPRVSHESGTLMDHCLRALRHAVRLGQHGLPLIGCGDWNDGMNQVGAAGRGESVWMGWFLMVVIDQFRPVLQARGEQALVAEFQSVRDRLLEQLELHAWDGAWYRRAFFDDGSPMGSHVNDECQIDSIAQSWAVFAGAQADRTDQALDEVLERLVRPEDHLVALLTPPFDRSTPNPGYIAGYVQGVRENGGQYTHAVLWLIQALAVKGNGDQAFAIFDLINPIRQTATALDVARYQVEPYVMVADIYSVPPHVGRGGWTWYTGSAAWTYRTAIENIVGLRRRGNQVSFCPCVPSNWGHINVTLRYGKSNWHFRIEFDCQKSGHGGARGLESPVTTMIDDGADHDVQVVCARRTPSPGVTAVVTTAEVESPSHGSSSLNSVGG